MSMYYYGKKKFKGKTYFYRISYYNYFINIFI